MTDGRIWFPHKNLNNTCIDAGYKAGKQINDVIIYTERQKSCTTFSFDFFWIEIDDYENQCSIIFMPVQKTIVVEKIKRV